MEKALEILRRAAVLRLLAAGQMNETIPPDCRRCGVCCFSASAEYVWVRGQDWSRLGLEADRLAHFIGHRAFMRMRDGHCAALEIRRDEAGRADYYCTIYERRPQICRDLGRGSPECLGELETKAATVAAAVTRPGGANAGPASSAEG